MRLHRFLPISLLFAACGDDGGARPDAGVRVDAPRSPDAAVDAGETIVDAPPDAPENPSATDRIWVVGDLETNNTAIAAGFDNTTAIPVTAAMAPVIKIPPMGTIYTSNNNQSFDARGGKIAYVADATVAGRFDIYAANADGGAPVLLVEGATGREFTSIALSPDGTKLAYLTDSVLIDGGYDLFMVTTTNPQAPVKLSPDRAIGGLTPANQDVFTTFTWSSDSKYLSFSADMETESYDQPYVVDTTVANPTAVALVNRNEITATMSRGVRGAILFDKDNNIYFRAHLDDTTTQFKLYKATVAGAGSRTALALPARGDNSPADVTSFGITPDGLKIVFAADAPTAGTYNLYASPLANYAPVAITNITPPAMGGTRPSTFAPFWFSPDSTRVAVTADWAEPPQGVTARRNEGFIVKLDGTTQMGTRIGAVQASCVGTCTVDQMAWSADGNTVYLLGDLVTANDTEIYKVPVTAADPVPTLVVDLVMAGDATNLFVLPL